MVGPPSSWSKDREDAFGYDPCGPRRQPPSLSIAETGRAQEDDVLLKAAVLLLVGWLLGAIGMYDLGQPVHVMLLVGLMLLLVSVLKARDAAALNDHHRTEKR